MTTDHDRTPALDAAATDPTVRPVDDFFRHVNGTWLDTAPIAEDRSTAGSFITLADASEQAVREIIEDLAAGRVEAPDEATADERAKLGQLYRDFMDVEHIDALGAAPLAPLLDRVEAIRTTDDLARHWGWSLRHQIPSLLEIGTEADMDDPTRHAMWVSQAGIGLPDRDYYLADEHAAIREAYRAHVERSLALAGIEDAPAQAGLVLELETAIAASHWDRVRCRDLVAAHNPMSWPEFAASAPGLHLDEMLDGARVTPDTLPLLIVTQPSFVTEMGEKVRPEELEGWRAWARWCIVRGLSPFLGRELVEENFDFYGRTLQGTPEMRPRWKRGVGLVEAVMGEALGKIYVERHFPAASKARMEELVANLLAAYAESIRALEWMGEQTRAEALHKLEGFEAKIGYPERWRDYSALEITAADLVRSILQANEFAFEHDLAKMHQPVDRGEWQMLPQTVNAYYHPLRNEIVFPAAILQPPFFNPDADDAVNYGGIGSVIGHEIGHGFDDQGSTCDGDGRLRNWWTDADREAFRERTGALVAQYEALTPRQLEGGEPAVHVNGALTIGENIGDLGGLTIALKAWRLATGGVDPEPVDGLTGVQRVFHGYASIWRSKQRDELLRQRLATDPHSPAEFRCNQIAKNLDAFHEAFGTRPGDGMWMEPAERVSIW